ncbi:MAG: hypothetical protein ABWZ77_06380 [Naasia sp.]
MPGVHIVEDLTTMSGRWVLAATSHGYFDVSPNIEAASLEYRSAGPGRMRFTVRFRIGTRVHRVVGRQSTTRSSDGRFRFSGWGQWLRVARVNWDLTIADDGMIAVAANSGSLVSRAGLMVFARDGYPWPEVRRRLAADHREFGITASQMRQFTWRDAGVRGVGFGALHAS